MPRHPLAITPIAAFSDNYFWLISKDGFAAIVDPGSAEPVESALKRQGLALSAILLTHHHQDHTGGVASLCERRPGLRVFGPAQESIPGVTHPLKEGDQASLEAFGLDFNVLEVPGHTRGHIAYFAETAAAPVLFCGDTLFAGGCGRLFEGTAEQMHRSLSRLAALPPETQVYCAHEYTLSNLAFAQAADPDNEAVTARVMAATQKRSSGQPTLPSSIAQEIKTNPFLRVDEPALRASAALHAGRQPQSSVDAFAMLRGWKDGFRA